jgi:hypothetical protein
VRKSHALGVASLVFSACLAGLACDKEAGSGGPVEAAATAVATTTPAAPEPPRAPDIVIDAANVAIGTDRVPTLEQGLADKVGVFVSGRPMIEGQTVSLVALRNAKPSPVVAVLAALHKAKAAAAVVRTEARDGTTQKLPVAFVTTPADCATVAWIGKDASINVWPAGGGPAKRVFKGLAGPDMTLGTDAIHKQLAGCSASEIYVGADDAMTWGLVFDLATPVLTAPGARVSNAVLVTNPALGRKLVLE